MLTKTGRLVLKKKNNSKIVCLTAYSKNIAEQIDKYAELVLVGDSLGSVLYNFDTTRKVNLSMMIEHSKSVRKGVKKSLMIVDMPFNTYKNKSQALKNCKKVIKETKCDGIKLEGGKKIIDIVKHLVKLKIPVMGHIGITPQSVKGKFKYKGKSIIEKNNLLKDSKSLEEAGVFAIVLESSTEIREGLFVKATGQFLSIPVGEEIIGRVVDPLGTTLDGKGNSVVLTPEQVKRGKRLFNNACGTCHVGGLTKTNPNVGLDTESLSLATPPRDNITSLVAYFKDPTTYDGLDSISEVHPSIKSADIFPKMRSLTDEDLFAIAGHILLQPKVVNENGVVVKFTTKFIISIQFISFS